MTKLDLLVLYQTALHKKSQDSVNIFMNLALLNAELRQPEDAYKYTEKYINNTLDFFILKNSSYDKIKGTPEYEELSETYLINIDLLTFIFFYIALIGFFFMIIINFSGKANIFAKLLISGFVGVHSLFILEFVFFISNYRFKFPHTYLMASTTALLYGPLLYLYFKSATDSYRLKVLDLLHFLPNVVLVVYLLPMYSLSGYEKIRIMLSQELSYDFGRYVIFVSKVISLSVYAILIGKLQYTNKRSLAVVDGQLPINKWKRTIYYLHVAYVICYVAYGLPVSGIFVFTSGFIGYAQVGAMSITVIYIAYMAYVQPSIFRKATKAEVLFNKKYQKSGLTNALSEELKGNLVQLLVDDKIFKQSNINLEALSEKLGTTRHNTSQIINEHFEMNFFELINTFRIREAVKMIEEDVHGNFNIIDIAYEVGYNNKVTFNKAFKKETGLTPTEYIQNKTSKQIKVNRK